MKEKAPLWLVLCLLFLGVVGGVMRIPSAYAGDDKIVTLNMSLDAGSAVICTSTTMSLKRLTVQPTVDTYVNVSPTNDGGLGVVDSDDTLVGANKMYDIWPTNDRRYICCKPAADGAASKCKIKVYREF